MMTSCYNARCFALFTRLGQMIHLFRFLSFWEPIALSSSKARLSFNYRTNAPTQKHKDDDMKSKKKVKATPQIYKARDENYMYEHINVKDTSGNHCEHNVLANSTLGGA
jgi:hypothetical protein